MAMKSMLIILFCSFCLFAEIRYSPFSTGYSMGNLGTIIWDNTFCATQSWIPAAFCDTALGKGINITAVTYYDDMDNLQDRSIYEVTGGGYFTSRYVNIKLSGTFFNALDTYYEQSLFLSTAVAILPSLKISMECRGYRIGIHDQRNAVHTIGELGFTAWLRIRYAAISLQSDHIVVKQSTASGTAPLLNVKCGIHTRTNRFGAQGVMIEITPQEEFPLRWKIGEEIRILKWMGIQIGLANNPVQVALGLSVDMNHSGVSASLVNHPQLGWSKGVFIGRFW